jgi:serine/threonine protein phosphatase PrpC
LEIATIRRPIHSERICGDVILVHHGTTTLVALADGLGHGPAAAEAAQAFCDYLGLHADDPMERLLRGASAAVTGTRGLAGAVLRFDEVAHQVEFAGVGNIEVTALSKSPIRPVCSPGIIGRPLRVVKPYQFDLAPGDLLVMHSDGISSRMDLKPHRDLAPQALAEQLLKEFGKRHDDASCVVVRY